jgi:hypothetical protein
VSRKSRAVADGVCCVCQRVIRAGQPVLYLLSRTSHRPAITHPGKCYAQALERGGIPND